MRKIGNKQPVLIVDDSVEDYYTLLRAISKSGIKNPVYRCETGDECLSFLYRKNEYKNPESSPTPGIILLDLNLPGTDGREVLEIIKNDPELKQIPVIILTTSAEKSDFISCSIMEADSYIQKPDSLEGFSDVISTIREDWFENGISE